jgi:ADP-heptose:LPS heptosyltransferase
VRSISEAIGVANGGTSVNLLRPLFRKGRTEAFTLPGLLGGESRILVIDSGDLSDLLFHVPLLQGIRASHPGARVDFLLPEEHTALVVPSGLARQCLVYAPQQLRPLSPAFWSLTRSIRRVRYDVAILMTLDPRPVLELVALASGAPLRLGPSHAHSWPAINFEVRPSAASGDYRGLRPARAAPFLGLDPCRLDRRWPLPEDKRRRTEQLVHFNKPRKEELLVGVDPGLGKSGHGIALKNLHFLIRQLASQTPCRILPLSDPRNQDRLRRFEAELTEPPPSLARDTLLETVLLLSQCDIFLAGNTDLFHFAIALSVPTIGLFTAQDGQQWDPGPRGSARILRVTGGERVDIDTLMEAVEAVTSSVARSHSERLSGQDMEWDAP